MTAHPAAICLWSVARRLCRFGAQRKTISLDLAGHGCRQGQFGDRRYPGCGDLRTAESSRPRRPANRPVDARTWSAVASSLDRWTNTATTHCMALYTIHRRPQIHVDRPDNWLVAPSTAKLRDWSAVRHMWMYSFTKASRLTGKDVRKTIYKGCRLLPHNSSHICN